MVALGGYLKVRQGQGMGMPTLAGVLAGGTVFVAGFLLCGAVYGFQHLGSPLRLMQNLAPYLLVVGLVLAVKWLVEVFAPQSAVFTLTGFGVALNVLKSPAIALLAASAMVCSWLKSKHAPIQVDWPISKTLKSCSGLFVFVLLAQILNFSGFLQGIVAVLAGVDNPLLLKLLSPLLAIASGFVTGSNTSANALLIRMCSTIWAHCPATVCCLPPFRTSVRDWLFSAPCRLLF